jgi:hypothetical protein
MGVQRGLGVVNTEEQFGFAHILNAIRSVPISRF